MNRKQKQKRLKRLRADQERRTRAALAAYEATGYEEDYDDDAEWLQELVRSSRRQRLLSAASLNGLLVPLVWGGHSLYTFDNWDNWLLSSAPLVLLTLYLGLCVRNWHRQRQEPL